MPEYSLIQIRSSPNWYIQWFENGHSRRASTRTADRGEAEAILAATRLIQATTPADDLTVSDALDWYWESYARDHTMRPDNSPGVPLSHYLSAHPEAGVRFTSGATLRTVLCGRGSQAMNSRMS